MMKRAAYIPISGKQAYKTQMIHANKIERMQNDKENEAVFQALLLFAVLTLRTEFDFGTKRLEKFIDEMKKYIDMFNNHDFSIYDANELIYDETGIEILDRKELKKTV